MKRFLSIVICFLTITALIISCKKNEYSENGEGSISAKEYTFNRATKTFDLGNEVQGQISASEGIRFIYCYLVRDNATDSLIHVTNATANNPTNYDLSIPLTSFPANNMSKVKGVKVLVKQGDNSSLQSFITIKYFDPSVPQFSNFPASITAVLTGGTTAITGTVKSEYGIKQVDIYDDYQTENTYVLVNSNTNTSSAKEFNVNYAYTYRKAAQHIKVTVTDIYNQVSELIINMPVDVSIFKPRFVSFPANITPNTVGTTTFSGSITSVTGLKRVDIYDDRNGAYVLLGSTANLAGVKTYTYNGAYNFAMRAEHIRLVAIDTDDLQTELIIPLNYTYLSKIYRDVAMNAQTTGTATIFIDSDGSTKGNCDLNASEATMAFLFYATSSGPTFYSPTNTTNVAANFRCNGTSWVIGNPSIMRATRFRVLVPGTSAAEDAVYADVAAGKLDDLGARLSSLTISSSGPRYDAATAGTSALFNATTANLIAVRIPDVGSPTTSKFALIRVKEATSSSGTSTIKFDIYIQK